MHNRLMSIIISVCALGLCAFGLCACGDKVNSQLAGQICDVKTEDNTHYTCSYNGMARDFSLYLPENVKDSVLIVALHGYGSDADSFARDTALHETANPAGYTVAYVSGIPDPDDKTAATGWNSGLKETGNDDAGFLSSLACYLQKEFSLDTRKCVAVGFSNGAFMTHRLAIDENRVFTDIVSVAGMMPQYAWETKPEKAQVNVLQICGTKDDVVPQKRSGTDKYSKAPAIEDVMEYYAASSNLTDVETADLTEKSQITRYSSSSDAHYIWEVSVKDGRHSWFEESFCGFVINDLIMEFLNAA